MFGGVIYLPGKNYLYFNYVNSDNILFYIPPCKCYNKTSMQLQELHTIGTPKMSDQIFILKLTKK